MLQYAPAGGKWWVQPYLHAAGEQSNLSTLDLSDRRTAAPRTRTNMRAFFLNGATNRGWVGAGPDGVMGSADDVLTATGETITQIQDRVLGVGVNSRRAVLSGRSYVTGGIRAGVKFGVHELMIRCGELERRELPRHLVGHRRARPRYLGEVRGEILGQVDR